MIDRITVPTARVKKLVKWPMKTRPTTGSCRPFPVRRMLSLPGCILAKKVYT